jgi:hypothetical protein
MKPVPSQNSGESRAHINVSSFSVGGGVAGLLCALAVIVIGLIGLGVTRWFLAGSVALGLLIAWILRRTARDRD